MWTAIALTQIWMLLCGDFFFFLYQLQKVQNLLLGGHTIHIQFCEYLELWLQILMDMLFMDEM
jgi:hypothetical protein